MLYGVARSNCIERLQSLYHHAGLSDDLFDQAADDCYAGTVFICSKHNARYNFVWEHRQLFLFLLKGAELFTMGHPDPVARQYHLQVLEVLDNYRQNPDLINWRKLAPLPRNPLGFDGTIGETLNNLIMSCHSPLVLRHQGNQYQVPPMQNHFLGHPIASQIPPEPGLVTAVVLAHHSLLESETNRIRQERALLITLPLPAALHKSGASLLVCKKSGPDSGAP
jgi:hypothetical protein